MLQRRPRGGARKRVAQLGRRRGGDENGDDHGGAAAAVCLASAASQDAAALNRTALEYAWSRPECEIGIVCHGGILEAILNSIPDEACVRDDVRSATAHTQNSLSLSCASYPELGPYNG